MKKWVVKRPHENAPLQVWEYIDTYEEASKYWYVKKAMRDYGIDEILPIAMNSMGGYHTLKPNSPEIVEIIESDERPKLDLIKQYPVAKSKVANGWMSPECIIYTCDPYGHVKLAERICDEFYDGPYTKDHKDNRVHDPDGKILKKGWVKIISYRWLGFLYKMTDKQTVKLEEFGYDVF